MQVHDELVFEVPEPEVEKVMDLVRRQMEGGDRTDGSSEGGDRLREELGRGALTLFHMSAEARNGST
jgi:hypothetical protein